jgi:small subunit ribosomal protein S4
MALVLEAIQSAERDTPDYMEIDNKGLSVKFVRAPDLAEVPYAVKMEPNLVVEFYAS